VDSDRQAAEVLARIRAALDEHERSGGSLPGLLAELKRLLHDLPEGEPGRLHEVLAGLRAVGRAWTQGESGDGTLAFEVERGVRDALAGLRRALDRLH
jgi:hypothetical protein